MPRFKTYDTIAGPLPLPNTMEFFRWIDSYLAYYRRYCQFKRTTTYYVDPVGGNDGSNGTSSATAWKSLTPVRTTLSSGTNNVAVLFKRGTVLKDATGLSVGFPSYHFGAYGSGDRPILSNFTINLASNTWTNAAGNRWTTTVPGSGANNPSGATTIGWLRNADSPFACFTFVDSTAKVEASTVPCFYVNGSTVHVNVLGDPNGTNLEANPGGNSGVSKSGIYAGPGSDKLWVDNLRLDGWGCQCQNTVNNSGLLNGNGSEEAAWFSNCETYYNGRHAISQESSNTADGNIGGVHIAENCLAGMCSTIGGANTFNSYSASGLQECVFLRCFERFGNLPADVTGQSNYPVAGGIQKEPTFSGHTGGVLVPSGFGSFTGNTYTVGLYLNIGCGIIDSRSDFSTFGYCTVGADCWAFADRPYAYSTTSAGQQQFVRGDWTDASTYRVFVIGYNSPRYRQTQSSIFETRSRMVFINCRFFQRKAHTSHNRFWNFTNGTSGLFLNCIIEAEDEGTSGDQYLINNGTAPSVFCRFVNCLFVIRGNSSGLFYLFSAGNAGALLANTVVAAPDRIYTDSAENVFLAGGNFDNSVIPANSSANLRYVAAPGCQQADIAPYPYKIGFSSATGYVSLTNGVDVPIPGVCLGSQTSPIMAAVDDGQVTLDKSHPLVGKGSSNPFGDIASSVGMLAAPQYDFFMRRRPITPSIGPFDYMNTTTATGSISGTMVGSMILGD